MPRSRLLIRVSERLSLAGIAREKSIFISIQLGFIIHIACRKFNDAMHMIWQDNPAMDDKGIGTLDFGKGVSQKADVLCQYMIVLALQAIYREEIRTSWIP